MTDPLNESGLQRGMDALNGGEGNSAGGSDVPSTRGASASAQNEPLPQVPGYEIIEEIGRGGMGVVYKARQLTPSRIVALKMVRGFAGWEERLRFLHEAEIVAELQHTHIVHLFEVGSTGDLPFYSMEFLEGGTLYSRQKTKSQTPQDAAKLMEQIARAVHFANERGIVHRDLKPANVLFSTDGLPKVSDFGVAKRTSNQLELTQSGMLMGTPHYMAPEQARADKTITASADVYSLGAMLYELLAGRPPFKEGESKVHICQRIIAEEPVSPAFSRPGLPRVLEAICLKCLQKDPSQRYASAGEFADDLAKFLSGDTTKARPAGRITRAVKWVKRHPRRSVLVAALLLAIIAVSYKLWYWDAYQREYIEHYHSFAGLKWGEVQGSGPKFNDEQIKHRYRTYRVHRRGRLGPVFAADVINGRGVTVSTDINLATWLQGTVKFDSNAVFCRNSYTLDADGRIFEETGYDGNGHALFRFRYDYQKGSADPRQDVLAQFIDPTGHALSSGFGATYVRFHRDNFGYDEKVTFEDGEGKAARNQDGIFGLKIARDPNHLPQRITNLDASGGPMSNIAGVVHMSMEWFPDGRLQRIHFFDRDDKPKEMIIGARKGVASQLFEYDANGNQTGMVYFDAQGKRTLCSDEYSGTRLKFNEQGDQLELRFVGASDEPVPCLPQGAFMIRFDAHDARGNGTELAYLDSKDKCVARRTRQFDGNDNLQSIQHKDGAGALIYRETIEYDQTQHRESFRIFTDPAGKPLPQFDGYTRFDVVYASSGAVEKRVYSGYPSASGYAKRVEELDRRGNIQKLYTLGPDDKLVMNAGGFATMTTEYDLSDRPVKRTLFDADNKPAYNRDNNNIEVNVYDPDSGRLLETWYYGKYAQAEIASFRTSFDVHQRVKEITFLDAQNKPIAGPAGYARQSFWYIGADPVPSVACYDAQDHPLEIEVWVKQVNPGGQGEKIGLKAGDVIEAIDDRPVQASSLIQLMRSQTGSRPSVMTIRRDGDKLRFNTQPGMFGIRMDERIVGTPTTRPFDPPSTMPSTAPTLIPR